KTSKTSKEPVKKPERPKVTIRPFKESGQSSASKPPMPVVPKSRQKAYFFNVDLNWLFSKGLVYLLIALLFFPMLFSLFGEGPAEQLSLSELVRDVREEKVEKIEVNG